MSCQVNIAPDCYGRGPLEKHHRLPRSHGGMSTPENLLLLCRACHHWVHAHPRQAYDIGLLVHSWDGPPSERWRGHESAETIGFGDA